VVDSLPSEDPGAQKRRSTRIVQAVPITVTGVDALGQPFKERTTTVMVNCHGCKYQSKHYVPKNSTVTLEIPRPEAGAPRRTLVGRVIWVQRPRAVRELFQIGLEFEIAGNVWGIAFPPDDWFPVPGEEPQAMAAPKAAAPELKPTPVESKPAAPTAVVPQPRPELQVPSPAPSAPPAASSAYAESKIHVVHEAAPASSAETQATIARQMSKLAADVKESLDKSLRRDAQTAINEEMTVVRQQLDAQLHDAVERAIKVSMERVSESSVRKVVQQAAEQTAKIVDEARRTTETNAGQLDEKIRQAVQQAVSHAAADAAQQAAAQAATQNLKQTVEDAVARIVAEREAASPSLQILANPEAAKQQLDQGKHNLEEAAQDVHSRTLEQAQSDAAAAKQTLNEAFESVITNASQTLDAKLSEASRSALARAAEEANARASNLRASLDQIVNGAESTVERTRQRLDEIASTRTDEIARRADELIAERTKQLEPALQNAAQSVIEQVSMQLDQKLAPGIAEAHEALSSLASAGEEAAQIESRLREQGRRAFEQAAHLEAQAQAKISEHAAGVQSQIQTKLSEQAAQFDNHIRDQVKQISTQAAQVQSVVREQVRQASEQAVADALDHVKQETAKFPAQFEESCRASLSKMEEELEQKSSEAQHTTFEALSKASDWYTKKAQTTMQSALERGVEQSTSALRDRAAEISSLVASELDHYRRTYVDHSQAQIEEIAKEVVDRERGKMTEAAEMTTAGFSDRIQQLVGESFSRFEEASRQALEKNRSDMEYEREGALTEFQKGLDDKMLSGIEQARDNLQIQLMSLIESFEAKRQAEQTEWMEQIKKSADESIESYKARLENASNSWLLASATTLGQSSQAVMDTLSRSAEKRLREVCGEVLAGMGDTLKERLLGISSGFSAEDEGKKPEKKK
jgi:vacuolar-type H+-ATPase subunit E/Vma4